MNILLKRLIILILIMVTIATANPGGDLSGYIKDTETGEPIPYANVILKGTDLGDATDVHGRFVILDVPAGKYNLFVSMMGYKSFSTSIKIIENQDKRVDLEIVPTDIQTQGVTVTAEEQRFKDKVETSRINITMKDILLTPAFVEQDVFRTLQMTPSVKSKNDFSSALVVRGGSPDENLIMLDGIEIYNPYHLGGVFSTFNAKAISDAEFIAGGFNAKYGNRNSSVLNITSREGNSRKKLLFKNSKFGDYFNLSGLSGEVSMLTSKFLAEGPVGNGSWMLAGRRTYFDKLAQAYYAFNDDELPGKYYFWDSQAKVIQDITDKDRLTYCGYFGRDFLEMDFDDDNGGGFGIDFDWGNYTSGLRWRHVPNTKIHSVTSLYHTNYDWDLNAEISQMDSLKDGKAYESTINYLEEVSLQDWTLKEELNFYATDHHTITTGFELKNINMKTYQKIQDITFLDQNRNVNIFGVFLQDKWKVNNLLSVQTGLRISRYNGHEHNYYDPRIGLKYLLSDNSSLKVSWGIYNQFIFTQNHEEEIINFVNFWGTVPEHLDAQTCQHYILGFERRFGNKFFASIEGYYKPYSNLMVNNPKNDPSIDKDDFIEGKGEAWGIELLLKKSVGKFSGWIGYSYSKLYRRVDFNSDGKIEKSADEVYNPKYDQPHSFNCVLSYKLNSKNSFGLTIKSASGQPYTPVVGKTFSQSNMGNYLNPYSELRNIVGQRNSARYPVYFRSDISWVRNIYPFDIEGKFKFQIINFTNHFNTLFYYWRHDRSPSEVTAISMFPIIPSIGFEFKI
ncbi:MAG: TonB-dependent receptor [Candidatus Marinimicrobia bacterium]|nr:TonB-dependent receptor [Candidatus Neomarinimicrobiota bacterium]